MCVRQRLFWILILIVLGLYSSTVALQKRTNISLMKDNSENRVLRLIIQAYTDDLLNDLQRHPTSQLTSTQMALLKGRMNDLHEHIAEHPALLQSSLWVGKRKPTFIPSISHFRHIENGFDRSEKGNRKIKRGSTYPSEEICNTETNWLQVNMTTDLYNKPVEVIQQEELGQYVFSFRCSTVHGPCRGISPLYESECTERLGWVYMYYRRQDSPDKRAQWGPVAVPNHCACKITPRFFPEL
ncbi:uncharacterized protein LOC143244922 isoform X1 [Tachypleus tridentatus]|uniref:uncharacterized protein LOC143244922 isoform X1 n=1 Tax=Tachypleus tridentatus TaxID=6853 RepID=UPI003FD0D281